MRFPNTLFSGPNLIFLELFLGVLSSVILKFFFIHQPRWPTFLLNPHHEKSSYGPGKLPEKKNYIYTSLYEAQIKSRGFSSWKQIFLLNISIRLFLIADAKTRIICLTAIVKMCSISCFVLTRT